MRTVPQPRRMGTSNTGRGGITICMHVRLIRKENYAKKGMSASTMTAIAGTTRLSLRPRTILAHTALTIVGGDYV